MVKYEEPTKEELEMRVFGNVLLTITKGVVIDKERVEYKSLNQPRCITTIGIKSKGNDDSPFAFPIYVDLARKRISVESFSYLDEANRLAHAYEEETGKDTFTIKKFYENGQPK